ncbi:hypothetical protein DPMN_194399 [Dreissena polymorpha]|uniref:Uncharacterized protein n=1 Tax=Dreissena polymorpha TaxID=45954 RepID=A0A9D3Y048_DREPO|nr:hypothetical protein DPMN_194399 [Dreissena polymorpha]
MLSIEVFNDESGMLEALHCLGIKSLSLRLGCYMEVKQTESLSQSLASLTRLEMLSIEVFNDESGMLEALHCLGIKSLSLRLGCYMEVKQTESLSQSLVSLTRLEMLSIKVYKDEPGIRGALREF